MALSMAEQRHWTKARATPMRPECRREIGTVGPAGSAYKGAPAVYGRAVDAQVIPPRRDKAVN
jgi:hypothetical protein